MFHVLYNMEKPKGTSSRIFNELKPQLYFKELTEETNSDVFSLYH